MPKKDKVNKYSNLQTFFLVSLRIIIGWYFLYEGLTKLVNPDWSSFGYLMDSKGWFSGMFHSLAGNPDIVVVIDWLNKWGLTMIGLGLMLGLLTRLALFAGLFLLMMYYLSHPPLAAVTYILPQEGSYLWVNKTLIEMVTMVVLILFPTSHIFGLDRFVLSSDKKSA
jgi:thiosulfate dehydrogenase [quinone] large subunit